MTPSARLWPLILVLLVHSGCADTPTRPARRATRRASAPPGARPWPSSGELEAASIYEVTLTYDAGTEVWKPEGEDARLGIEFTNAELHPILTTRRDEPLRCAFSPLTKRDYGALTVWTCRLINAEALDSGG